MNTQTIIDILKAWGINWADNTLAVMIHAQLFSNPQEGNQAIADNIVGFVKHNVLRAKFGAIADFLMPFIEPALRAEIAKEIPIVRQAITQNTPVVPPAPAEPLAP